jgi:hypothetical protein
MNSKEATIEYNHGASAKVTHGQAPSAVLGVTIKHLKDALCEVQGRFAQYAYRCYVAQRDLQIALNKGDISDIRKYYDELNYILNENLEADLRVFTQKIRNTFEYKGGQYPRVCFKRPFSENDVEKVIVICRDRDTSYTNEYELEKNTGFRIVNNTGVYFICNDIPVAISEERYDNPRLEQNNLAAFRMEYNKYNHGLMKILSKCHLISKSSIDKAWKSAWKDSNTENVKDDERYKSTLIIPITLAKNALSAKFVQEFFPVASRNSVFGFLCFDYHEKDYFDEDVDASIGYIFADMISFHFLTHYSHTKLVTSYKRARKILDAEEKGST